MCCTSVPLNGSSLYSRLTRTFSPVGRSMGDLLKQSRSLTKDREHLVRQKSDKYLFVCIWIPSALHPFQPTTFLSSSAFMAHLIFTQRSNNQSPSKNTSSCNLLPSLETCVSKYGILEVKKAQLRKLREKSLHLIWSINS